MPFRLTASPGRSIRKRVARGRQMLGGWARILGEKGHRPRPPPALQAEGHRGRPPSRVPRRVSRAGLPGSRRFPGRPPTGSRPPLREQRAPRRAFAFGPLSCPPAAIAGKAPPLLGPGHPGSPLLPPGPRAPGCARVRRAWAGQKRLRSQRAGGDSCGTQTPWDLREGSGNSAPPLPPAPLRLLPQSGEDQLGNPSQGLG